MIKRLLTSLFATSVAVAAPTTATDDKSWSVGQAIVQGKPIIIRLKSTLPEGFNPAGYPFMIAITWKFSSPQGMPPKEIREQMNLMEESLTAQVETSNVALHTAVVTGNGVTEWQFYTRDKDEFMQSLNAAFFQKPQFPIELSLNRDPEWAAYHKFKPSK